MLSCNIYHLTWVCLTLDMGYLFTAAPAMRSHCSLPWMGRLDWFQIEKELKVRKGGSEEIPIIQGKEQWLCFAGAAVKRYPKPKVRETQIRW